MTVQGTTFSNYFVTDSLCCPSRASILRGQYVHDHGVLDNLPPERWLRALAAAQGDDSSTVATWLHDAGYRTALLGKYLNGYPNTVAPTYVPPGWDEWASPQPRQPVLGVQLHAQRERQARAATASTPKDYCVDVLRRGRRTTSSTARSQGGQAVLPLRGAVYVPHQPATPAPRVRRRRSPACGRRARRRSTRRTCAPSRRDVRDRACS